MADETTTIKPTFGVKKNADNKTLSRDRYETLAGILHSRIGVLASHCETETFPVGDGSVGEDGEANPDFDEAVAEVLEDVENVAREIVERAAKLRSALNARPKAME